MLLLKADKLPEGSEWSYELKLDGYRAIAFKSAGRVFLRSRNDNDFTARYQPIATALAGLPEETIVDGEIVALDQEGRPSFNALQNYGSSQAPLLFYLFDILMVSGKEVMGETLAHRRELLQTRILPNLEEPARLSPQQNASLS